MAGEMTDIVKNEVGSVVQNAINNGKTKIECFEQPDGKWTVKAD